MIGAETGQTNEHGSYANHHWALVDSVKLTAYSQTAWRL